MTAEREFEKGISEIVGAICDPIIVFPGGDSSSWKVAFRVPRKEG